MAKDVQFEGKDTSKVAEAGSTYGEINIEKLAAAKPDLIVTTTYAPDNKKLLYGFKDAAQLTQVRKIAPVRRGPDGGPGRRGGRTLRAAGEGARRRPRGRLRVRGVSREAGRRSAAVAELPAVRAGHLWPWKFASMDYVDQAKAMSQLAGWLTSAEKVA